MSIAFFFLYTKEKKAFLLIMTVAWIIYCLRFGLVIISLQIPSNPFLEALVLAISLVNALLIYLGIEKMMNKPHTPWVFNGGVTLALLTLSCSWFPLWFNAFEWLTFLFAGSIFIYAGVSIMSYYRNVPHLPKVLGGLFILWGVHKFDFPVLGQVPWFAPIGYLMSAMFQFSIALTILFLFYELINQELNQDEDRLKGLLELFQSDVNSQRELLDRVLSTGLELTGSKYGYIYFYNESTQTFTLNTWSGNVHKDCEVMDQETQYKLEQTGCWGEAVRQRKAYILNNYSPDDDKTKGTPKGHVPIKNFLTVPTFINGEIVAVIGVANKEKDYDSADQRQLTLLMDSIWYRVLQLRYTQELKEAKEKAEESNKVKNAFLANISHELRTPLNGIFGMAALIQNYDLNPEQKNYLSLLKKSGYDLLSIVNDLLNISQIDKKKLTFIKEKFSLTKVIKKLVSSYTKSQSNRGIQINFDSSKEVFYMGDRGKVAQIINNILSNAVKFTDRGEIRIIVTEGEHLVIIIEDQGIGIPPTLINQVTDRFYFSEEAYTKTRRGAGLGLSISKELLNQMGGELGISSTVGKGTKVEILLPIEKVSDYYPEEERVSEAEKIPLKPLDDNSILVVEDEAINRLYIRSILEKQGYTVVEAENGKKALEVLQQKPMDLVLMDVGMPIMNGVEATRIIKSSQDLRTIPIIGVTAHSTQEEQREFLNSGMTKVITKPFQKDILISEVRNLLEAEKNLL